MENKKPTFFQEIGGIQTIQKIHKNFYDKIYADNWIGKFFRDIDQGVIESQQTDFMAQNFGGPSLYLGKLPLAAHKHMLITEELFELRRSYLEESLKEAKLIPEHIEKWLKVDEAFKTGIIKKSASDCIKRYNSDEIQVFEKVYKKS